MSNSHLFIAGSIHQGHQRFGDISRGRQCSFISFSALLCAQNLPIEQWTAATVDQILDEGDKLYTDALQKRSIPDTETLSLNYLPNIAFCSIEANTNKFSISAKTNDSLIRAESQTTYPLIRAENNIQSLTWVTNTDLPVVEANNNLLWLVNYEPFYQGNIKRDEHENEAPYFTLHGINECFQ